MKKIAYGFAAAALLAGTQFLVPANAMMAPPVGAAATSERCRPAITIIIIGGFAPCEP
jgi:hypothetical protein